MLQTRIFYEGGVSVERVVYEGCAAGYEPVLRIARVEYDRIHAEQVAYDARSMQAAMIALVCGGLPVLVGIRALGGSDIAAHLGEAGTIGRFAAFLGACTVVTLLMLGTFALLDRWYVRSVRPALDARVAALGCSGVVFHASSTQASRTRALLVPVS